MGFFARLAKLFPQMVQDPSFGQPIGLGKNIIPIDMIPFATHVRDSALHALPAGNGRFLLRALAGSGVPQGSNAPAASGKGPTDIIGGLGAPEQLPGGGYRVFDNRTGKYIYGGGATDPNAPATPRVTPAEPSPATPDIGQIVGRWFKPRSFGGGGFLGNLMSILGGAFPQGPGTENAPTGFGRFLRSLAANRFIS